ncbi:STAS domain-containing protein [Dyella sp. A6]|uniref:STAS domain-containing protein n=1 Tax=Dyella aluminiiresistens TaxID=3069105 RepID=UPI002E762E3A|nr:STAS domain-containing protein [Dyella sp. A6]
MDAKGFQLDCSLPDTVKVSGRLSFATAAAVLEALGGAFARGRATQLDLAAVESCDSAGLACVLAVLAEASAASRPVRVLNVPAGMHDLAQVSGVASLIAV